MPPAVPLPEIFQITVEHHDGVIHNHAEHDDKSCQCYRVEGDTQQIHDAYADEGGKGDGDGSHNGRAEGEEYHHHQDDDEHRFDEVQEEVLHGVAHYLRLVGYTGDGDILWQHVFTEIIK